ncbi:MAG TPA: hypothetical protein DCX07_12800, partial [Phycisphaerales bacterium]|nr:hypothetical protein [Phycisphaerales bacterium]
MAIPIGTTARQISRIARWTLTGVVTIGMLSWWWPSFEAWGSLVGGLLAVFTLWVLWRVVVGDRAVPGHPLHLAMAAPAVILVVHLVRGIANRHENPAGLSSAMDASMIFQFAVLALGVMLSQSLLPKATEHASVLSVCGGAMILGSLAAIFLADPGPVRSALALLGFAGIAVWLSPLWTRGGAGQLALSPGLRARLRRLCVVLAVLAAGALGALSPEAALVTGAVVGGIVLAAGGVFRGSRRPLLACGSLLLAGVAAVIVLWRPEMPFA